MYAPNEYRARVGCCLERVAAPNDDIRLFAHLQGTNTIRDTPQARRIDGDCRKRCSVGEAIGNSRTGIEPDRTQAVEITLRLDRNEDAGPVQARGIILADDLAARGWRSGRIEKILRLNFLRVFTEVWG